MTDVSIAFLFDLTMAEAQLSEMQSKIDAQQAEWEQKRRVILTQIRDISMGIQLTIQSIRAVARATGQTITPVQGALMSIISTTTSLIIATATTMAMTSIGILAGAALAIAAFAWSFQMVTTARLIAESDEFRTTLAAVQARLASLQGSVQMFGGSV